MTTTIKLPAAVYVNNVDEIMPWLYENCKGVATFQLSAGPLPTQSFYALHFDGVGLHGNLNGEENHLIYWLDDVQYAIRQQELDKIKFPDEPQNGLFTDPMMIAAFDDDETATLFTLRWS